MSTDIGDSFFQYSARSPILNFRPRSHGDSVLGHVASRPVSDVFTFLANKACAQCRPARGWTLIITVGGLFSVSSTERFVSARIIIDTQVDSKGSGALNN